MQYATPGEFRERLRFEQRGAQSASGDGLGPWQLVFTSRARVIYLHGSESVMGERLQGNLPAILSLPWCASAASIDNSFRAVDANDTTAIYNVTSVELDPLRRQVDVLVNRRVRQPNDG